MMDHRDAWTRGEAEIALRLSAEGWTIQSDWRDGAPLGWICRWMVADHPHGARKVITSSAGYLTGIWPARLALPDRFRRR
jgi:hypothetical protein